MIDTSETFWQYPLDTNTDSLYQDQDSPALFFIINDCESKNQTIAIQISQNGKLEPVQSLIWLCISEWKVKTARKDSIGRRCGVERPSRGQTADISFTRTADPSLRICPTWTFCCG